jgi:hypothetical protein
MCGPCASLKSCPNCSSDYTEGDLIIQCQQCNRWLHGGCDLIRNETEAETCAEEGYTCLLCRPSDVPPPHLNPAVIAAKLAMATPSPPKSPMAPSVTPECPANASNSASSGVFVNNKPKSQAQYVLDGVCLSEGGMNLLRSLQLDQPRRRVRGKGKSQVTDAEAGIWATIESVVSGGQRRPDSSLDGQDGDKGDGDGDDGCDLFKDGQILAPREDGRMPEVPEGYTVVQGENGVLILRKKRQRNLQKLGIGGFQVRRPWARVKDKEEDAMDTAEISLKDVPGTSTNGVPTTTTPEGSIADPSGIKPKRKPQRRKPKNKLVETYPVYLQEAFFGRDLLDIKKSGGSITSGVGDNSCDGSVLGAGVSSDSEEEDVPIVPVKEISVIQLSEEEKAAVTDDLKNRQPTIVRINPVVMAPQATPAVRPAQQLPHQPQPAQSAQQPLMRPSLPVNRLATPAGFVLQRAPMPINQQQQTPQQALGSRAPLVRVPTHAIPPRAAAVVNPVRMAAPAGSQPPQPPPMLAAVEVKKRPEVKTDLDDVVDEAEAALKDILPLTGELLDSDDLVDSIMKEGGDDLGADDPAGRNGAGASPKDELTDILSDHINLDTMVAEGLPNMDSKDVEDLFKGVLTDESQESADSSYLSVNATPSPAAPPASASSANLAPSSLTGPGAYMAPHLSGATPQQPQPPAVAIVRALSTSQGTASPSSGLPPPSPYPSEYSSSPGFSPAFSEPPPSPWPAGASGPSGAAGVDHDVEVPSVNQRNALKWEADETLGLSATISAVLYANTNHPDLKRDYPGQYLRPLLS